jgi:hypothetical protein
MRYHHLVHHPHSEASEQRRLEFNLKQYIAGISRFNGILERLGKELNLNLESRPVHDLGLYFDPELPAASSPIFNFKPNRLKEIPIANSDETLKTPYSGLQSLKLTKQEE